MNERSEVLRSKWAELAVRANKHGERPSGPLKTLLSVTRNAPLERNILVANSFKGSIPSRQVTMREVDSEELEAVKNLAMTVMDMSKPVWKLSLPSIFLFIFVICSFGNIQYKLVHQLGIER